MGYTPHVLVAGGGIVGTAIARDLAIRGLDVTLVERGTLTSGTTGRDGGLLESGARFAASDPQTAKRCAVERKRVREIASHYVTETGGLLIEHADDDPEPLDDVESACEQFGIDTTELAGAALQESAPWLGDDVERALEVPDATVDPQLLTVATARSAQEHGASIRTETALTAIHLSDGALDRVELTTSDRVTGRRGRPMFEEEDSEKTDEDETSDEADEVDEEDGETDEQADEVDEDETADQTEETDEKDDETDEPSSSGDGTEEPVTDGGREDLISHKGKTLPGSGGSNEDEKETEQLTGETEELAVDYLVNATGAWAETVAELADLSVPLETVDDARVVLDGAPVDRPVSPIASVDSAQVVPNGDGCLVKHEQAGETTATEPASDPDESSRHDKQYSDLVQPEAVDAVLDAWESLVPDLTAATPNRSARGRRYAVAGHGRPRNEHDFVRIDHGKQHDCWGLMTVLGGSLTTHRLLAERVADAVCTEFGISRPCQTADIPLPGCDTESAETESKPTLPESVVEASSRRLGSRTRSVLAAKENPVFCPDCGLTRAEVHDTVTDGNQLDLLDVCIRTGCESSFWTADGCLDALVAERYPPAEEPVIDGILVDMLEHYWPGYRAVAWDRRLTTMARTHQTQTGWLNRRQPAQLDALEAFDAGIESDRAEREPFSARNMGQWADVDELGSNGLSFDFGGDQR